MDHTWGTALLHTYRWAALAARVVDSGFADSLRSVGAQIASIVGVPNLEPLPEDPAALSKWCSALRKNLEGPDFNLALDLAPQVTPNLAVELSQQAKQLRKLVGRAVRIPAPTRAIFQVASLERGSITLSEIYRVMRERRHLINEGAAQSILSAGFWGHTIEELFSGKLEAGHRHHGDPDAVRSAALAGMAQVFFGSCSMIDGVMSTSLDQGVEKWQPYADLLPNVDSAFDFLQHPLLELALVAYRSIEGWMESRAFQGEGYLAPRQPHWEWVTRRPMIKITSDL